VQQHNATAANTTVTSGVPDALATLAPAAAVTAGCATCVTGAPDKVVHAAPVRPEALARRVPHRHSQVLEGTRERRRVLGGGVDNVGDAGTPQGGDVQGIL
jgi:hypothetical protein